MKHFLQKTIFTLLLLSQVDSAFAYIVKGTVVDATGKPVHKVLVVGRNNANKVVIGIETDQMGQFVSAEVNDSALSIEISKDNFVPIKIDISGTPNQLMDLGTITLFERQVTLGDVVVTAELCISLAAILSSRRKKNWGTRQTVCPCSMLCSINCQA